MIAVIGTVLIIIVLYCFAKSSENVGHWSTLIPNMKYDPEDFYNLVKEILIERQVPDFKESVFALSEGNILSHNRLYLKVTRGSYNIFICGAPWGTSFFFSWWIEKDINPLTRLPYIGSMFAESTAYYKLDSNTMFRTSVHQSVLEAIDNLTAKKGIRGLSELERQPDLRSLLK